MDHRDGADDTADAGRGSEASSGAAGRPVRVCFVALTIFPTLAPSSGVQRTGGSEIQQKLLGEALAAEGYDVSYLTLDHGQPDGCRLDNVTVYKTYREYAGIPGLRFIYPRVPRVWRALRRADADVYYVRGAGYLPGIVARFARRHGRRFVFASASDANVDPALLRLPTRRDRWLYEYGLRRSDGRVVQSCHQAELLRAHYGLDARVIRNIWQERASPTARAERRYVLWIAMFRPLKQPEHFLRLARAFPDEEFVMVGGPLPGSRALYRDIRDRAAAIPNLRFLGYQSLAETERLLERAKVVVNTSRYEGFPNTFLQAWVRGVPVLSYVDPDDVIRKHGLGFVAGSERELHLGLRCLIAESRYDERSIARYFDANHSPAAAVAAFRRLFRGMNLESRYGERAEHVRRSGRSGDAAHPGG